MQGGANVIDAVLVSEPGGMKVDARGRDIADLRRQEERVRELSGPVTVRKLTPDERIRYGLQLDAEVAKP